MAMPKTHAIKTFPDGRKIALCWKNVPDTMLTENEAAVDCKKCLRQIDINREAAADWQKRSAEFLQGVR